MKWNKRKVFISALAICLVSIVSFGTLAWFTDSASIKNDFVIGGDGNVFNVKIYQKVPAPTQQDPNAVYKDEDGLNHGYDPTNQYVNYSENRQEVRPGASIPKDMWVYNDGQHDMYIRVKVTVNKAEKWKEILGSDDLGALLGLSGAPDSSWVRNAADTVEDTVNDTVTYVYYYDGVVAPSEEYQFLKTVEIPESLEVNDVVEMSKAFSVSFVAEAVQAHEMLANYDANDQAANAVASFAMVAPAAPQP